MYEDLIRELDLSPNGSLRMNDFQSHLRDPRCLLTLNLTLNLNLSLTLLSQEPKPNIATNI